MLQNQSENESPTVMEIAIKFSIFFTETDYRKYTARKADTFISPLVWIRLSKAENSLLLCTEHKCLSTSLEYKTYLVIEQMMSTESQIPLCIT